MVSEEEESVGRAEMIEAGNDEGYEVAEEDENEDENENENENEEETEEEMEGDNEDEDGEVVEMWTEGDATRQRIVLLDDEMVEIWIAGEEPEIIRIRN
ncbi:hypothetical protein PHLCEN_2v2081 [Hermanssonia centrifuga]|uniref:Uncharacterized protein n=1 Tax=Hermanssonia centrifuga TaxID=98765 RepID=A0A2R6RQ39_9APHY|nr:hypothetical protein PHLCEN_2v2081 [Hermanssonia centrifuga]